MERKRKGERKRREGEEEKEDKEEEKGEEEESEEKVRKKKREEAEQSKDFILCAYKVLGLRPVPFSLSAHHSTGTRTDMW